MSLTEDTRAAILAVGMAQYDHWPRLDQVTKDVDTLVGLLEAHGFVSEAPTIRQGGRATEVMSVLGAWFEEGRAYERLLVLWSGHGCREGDGLYLVAKDSPLSSLILGNAIPANQLGSIVAKSRAKRIVVLLDTCFAGTGAAELASNATKILDAYLPLERRGIAVLASAHALETARDGAFARALLEVLREGPPNGPWTERDSLITSEELATAVGDLLGKEGIPQSIGHKLHGIVGPFFPNPRYQPGVPDEDVESALRRRSMRPTEAEAHFLPAARGIEVGDTGWYFTGRERLLRELVHWLETASRGMTVVTGGPGTGKSAVLGRLATLSDPVYRAAAEREGVLAAAAEGTVPPKDEIDVAIHGKGKTLDDCVTAIADALGLRNSPEAPLRPAELVELVGELKRPVTVVLDALDEVKRSQIPVLAGDLLLPLAKVPGVRVLVGTRQTHVRLLGEATVHDLDQEATSADDICDYVKTRLLDQQFDSPYHGLTKLAYDVGRMVAERAAGVFLFARIIAHILRDSDAPWLPDSEEWRRLLEGGVRAAFEADLARFDEDEPRVRDLLRPLAWAEGAGLPRRQVWPAMATALSSLGMTYTDSDVGWVLRVSGYHITESGEAEQTVYRLYHQYFADYFRQEGADGEATAQRKITTALLQLIGEGGPAWLDANPYVSHHLSGHATAGGRLDQIVTDSAFLAVTEPERLLRVFGRAGNATARGIVNSYRRVADRLPEIEPRQRAALLELTALQHQPDVAAQLAPRFAVPWRALWARWRRTSSSHQRLNGHTGPANAVAFGQVGVPTRLASGGDDGTVRLWNPTTGELVDVLRGHTDPVLSVAFGQVGNITLLASSSDDGTVCLWNPSTGELVDVLRGHADSVYSVAFGHVRGNTLLASSSDDGTVRLWDPTTGKPTAVLQGHTDWVRAVAFGHFGHVEDTMLLASSSDDGTVRLWDPVSGKPTKVLRGHTGPVLSVAFGRVNDTTLLASGGDDGAVRLWNPTADESIVLQGHADPVLSVTFGKVEDITLLAAADTDGRVQLWNPVTGRRLAVLQAHTREVWGVTFGHAEGVTLIGSADADGAVRLWEPVIGELTAVSSDQTSPVTALTYGQAKDATLLASVGDHSGVQLWDPFTGARKRVLQSDHGRVTSVAFGQAEDTVLMATVKDEVVELWDPLTGTHNRTLRGHTGPIGAITFIHIEGTTLLATASDKTVELWDPLTGTHSHDLQSDYGHITSVTFGQVEGAALLAAASDKTVELWDPLTGTHNRTLRGPTGPIGAITFIRTEGAQLLAAAGYDETVHLWELVNGELTTIQRGYRTRAEVVTFGSVENITLLASGHDRIVRLRDPLTAEHMIDVPVGGSVTSLCWGSDAVLYVGTSEGLVALQLTPLHWPFNDGDY